jgi:7-cyano-7-deazaguanine synthase
VIRQGLEIGVDYASTYSCLLGYPRQCGSCPQCGKRRAAFADLGLEDPAGFKRPAQ